MKKSGNTILMTGGNSGIGRELALRFADLENTVIVAGRDKVRLEQVVAGRSNMHPMTFNAADAGDTLRLAQKVIEAFPGCNVLINNAGIMRNESIAAWRNLSDTEETVAVNLLGPIRLTNALVDHLAQQPHAAIINVTSGLAFVPRPSAAVYSATKAAMRSFTVSLRYQLKGRVEVIELAPPAVQTELTPGQSTNPRAMPLKAFIDETMVLLAQEPTPSEILVQRVHFQRFAERSGTFDEVADMLASR